MAELTRSRRIARLCREALADDGVGQNIFDPLLALITEYEAERSRISTNVDECELRYACLFDRLAYETPPCVSPPGMHAALVLIAEEQLNGETDMSAALAGVVADYLASLGAKPSMTPASS